MEYNEKTGYDLSHWNKLSDNVLDDPEYSKKWARVRDRVEFLILKIGGSEARRTKNNPMGYEYDKTFTRRAALCRMYKIPYGGYWFAGSGFLSHDTGYHNAEKCLSVLSNAIGVSEKKLKKAIPLPIFIDIEAPVPAGEQKKVTAAALGFLERIQKAGLEYGIYGSDIATYKNRIHIDVIREQFPKCYLWVARYGKKPVYIKDWDIWQYTSDGTDPDIPGRIDVNIWR